jgi:hypothetical protein
MRSGSSAAIASSRSPSSEPTFVLPASCGCRYEGMMPFGVALPTGTMPSASTASISPVSSTTTRSGFRSSRVVPRAWVMVRGNTPGAASAPSFAVASSAVEKSRPPVATSVLPGPVDPVPGAPPHPATSASTSAPAAAIRRIEPPSLQLREA